MSDMKTDNSENKPIMSSQLPPRFVVVTDGDENTVFDNKKERDLFPTKSGNRDYQCKTCRPWTAKHIAAALNLWQELHGNKRLD